MKKNKQLVPKRRFKEFENDGEWEEHKLGELSTIVRGASPRPIQNPKWFDSNSNVGWLRIADVTKQDGRIYYLEQKLSEAGQEKTRVLKTPHLLLSIAATVGKPVINYVNTGVHDGFLIFLTPNFDQEFMFQWLEMFRVKWQKYGQPGSQVNLNSDLVINQDVVLPKIEEQKKIGSYFEELDKMLNIQQQKLEKIESLKKSYLVDMFPKEGEKYPKKRFGGFIEPWDEYQLGELSNIVRGASPRPIKDPKWFDSKSGVGWLRISDVTEQDGRIHYLEQKISKAGQEKTRVIKSPHLLLSIAATVGKPVINYVYTGVHDGFLIFLDPKFDKEFMFQWLEMFRAKWQKYGQPGSQVNLNSDIVKNQNVMIPSTEEQVKIADFFKNLDAQIALEEKKLNKLEQLKQACLNELFV